MRLMNRKTLFLPNVILIVLGVAVFAAQTYVVVRLPGICEDSDVNCDFTNLNANDAFVEPVNLKVNPFGFIRSYTFTNNITNASSINNITINVEWRNNPTGRGADLQNISIYNGTNWVQCAGPFGDTGSFTNATCLFIGSNLTGNFTTNDSVNTINVNFTGVDNNGGSPASAEIDYVEIIVNYTP